VSGELVCAPRGVCGGMWRGEGGFLGGDTLIRALAGSSLSFSRPTHSSFTLHPLSPSLPLTLPPPQTHTPTHPQPGGHYTTDSLQPDGKWLRFDDAQVDLVPIELVLAERPYILLYQRVHPR
jgi:hypothetical protein